MVSIRCVEVLYLLFSSSSSSLATCIVVRIIPACFHSLLSVVCNDASRDVHHVRWPHAWQISGSSPVSKIDLHLETQSWALWTNTRTCPTSRPSLSFDRPIAITRSQPFPSHYLVILLIGKSFLFNCGFVPKHIHMIDYSSRLRLLFCLKIRRASQAHTTCIDAALFFQGCRRSVLGIPLLVLGERYLLHTHYTSI